MARLQKDNHSTVVTGSNDGTKQVSKDAWNAEHNITGMEGYEAQSAEIIIASGVLILTDTLTYAGAESGTADTLDSFDNTNTQVIDKVILFPTTGDTITVTHTETPSVAGQIHLADHTDRVLSETEPLVLYRVGTYWYEQLTTRIFLDSEFKVVNSSDPTKKFVISLAGETTAKTATLVFANPLDASYTFPAATATLASLAGSETLSNKILTAAKIASGGFLADANGNELLIFTSTASAVNELTYANAATGNNPTITASGETNVGIQFIPKGTGYVFGAVETIEVALSDDAATSVPTTGVKYTSMPMPADFKVIGVPVAGVKTAGTGATLVEVDILVEDSVNANTFTTIFSTRPTIDASEFTSTTGATPAVLASIPTTIAKGKRVQYKIHAVDSNSLVRGIKCGMRGYYSAV